MTQKKRPTTFTKKMPTTVHRLTEKFPVRIQEMIDSYSAHGGGHAEDGLCGALYAAKTLINDPKKTERLNKEFLKKAGSVKCREIMKLKSFPVPTVLILRLKLSIKQNSSIKTSPDFI